MNEKICLVSLGCDKNRIDAEIMAQSLISSGYQLTDIPETADCAVINTCGFIESAKQEAIDAVFDMVRLKEDPAFPLRTVVVTGCLAQRYCKELSDDIPEVDAVTGLGLNGEISKTVESALLGSRTVAADEPEKLIITGPRYLSTPGHYSYIKIAEGCDNRCTYCAIPGIRGRYRSRPRAEIVKEAKTLLSGGVKELILVAQDTTLYGSDFGDTAGLVGLLRELASLDGLWKLRILYAYPDHLDDALIDCIADEPKIAKYIDIPLQHANAEVLRRMHRFGNRGELEALVSKLRSRIPGIAIRSTFMVGFPGETEEQFLELKSFCRAAEFDRAGCFVFSPEEGTPAALLKESLSQIEKEQRKDGLMTLLTGVLYDKQLGQIGKTVEAICDGFDSEQNMYVLRSEYDCPEVDTVIYALGEKTPDAGEIVDVEITGSDGCDLFGHIL